ncbi:phosphoribosylamine--glycine ligase [Holotrichia oblita]|nr:phosphoribosylamine--glycine ligase [Holotrichia oblita]
MVMNVHSALIPSFCGAGFYGMKVHEAVLAKGVKLTGATVHFVNEETDGGPIIIQKAVAVDENDTPETLQKRVMQEAEWVAYVEAVRLFAENRLKVEGNIVRILSLFINNKLGESGKKVVIEEFLTGPEVSILAFCDGKTIVPMVSAQDHKRVFDNDQGLNTGGMGAFSPSRYYTYDISRECEEKIFRPTVQALINENIQYKGVIFFGLMLTASGVKVIEYNSRFGDPETQVVLPRLQNDLLELLIACTKGTLEQVDIQWSQGGSACVILASGGYPEAYQKGYPISGLDRLKDKEDVIAFHAGTLAKDGVTLTNGGRVLGVTAVAPTLDEAIKQAYQGVNVINFDKMHFRKDIGEK